MIKGRNMRGYEAAQRAYDRMQPPEYYEYDYEDDCVDGKCGLCYECAKKAEEIYLEERVEAAIERRRGY